MPRRVLTTPNCKASRPASLVWAFLAALLLVAGCASNEGGGSKSARGNYIAEYQQVATDADQAMRAALHSLAVMSAQSNRCSPAVLSEFSAEVRRLQVDSFTIRARSLAMQARGDAYFQQWQKHLASIEDPEVRMLAQTQRPALEAAFQKVKQWSQEGHEAFEPFLANLRQVRNALEKDPESLDASRTRKWLAAAAASGEHVERCIASVSRELDAVTAMLTPGGNTSKPEAAR